jgi:prophage regulatory protein
MPERITLPTIERLPQVLARTGLSRTVLYRLMEAGKFPQSVAIADRARGWDSRAITKWINTRSASNRATA